jgi:hypothetical protein
VRGLSLLNLCTCRLLLVVLLLQKRALRGGTGWALLPRA